VEEEVSICDVCLHPKATQAQWDNDNDHGDGNGCQCAECASVCWGDAVWCRKVAADRKRKQVTPASYWKQVREACERATPGPWKAWKKTVADWTTTGVEGPEFYDDNGNDYVDVLRECFRNAEFIALSRTALPLALARIEELEAALDQISDSFVTSLEATELTAIARAALGKP
jgi:hypothetical protein